MNRDTLGVGIVGAGVISQEYLNNLKRMPHLDVRWVADQDINRAASRAQQFGVPHAGTVDDMLADTSVDIVVNLTIPAAHHEISSRAIEAGKNVWSEKPLSLDVKSGRELLEQAKHRGVRIASAPDTILGAGFQNALRLVSSGAIGTPITATAIFQTDGPESWHPAPAFLYAQGAGPLFDIGPYYLAALAQILGPARSVSAVGTRSRDTRTIASGPNAGTTFPVEVFTHVSALITFETGSTAQVTLSFDSSLPRAGIVEISGTEGTLAFPDPNEFAGATHLWRRGANQPEVVPSPTFDWSRGIGVSNLASSLLSGQIEHANGNFALHVLDIMESINEAAVSNQVVEISSRFIPTAPLSAGWDPAKPNNEGK
ncbi:Gfo/Idh/MocA family protein [Populibacterium corticicola]|uniref:Gfo/Idh/MocA family protein n=1 Tax=Populibacterium corticicola TaxID=1812826 RepID=A0ABW5XFK4_9MICO